eukprot:gene17307-20599_t
MPTLANLLDDEDTSVASAASSVLRLLAEQEEGMELLLGDSPMATTLRNLANSAHSVTQLRVFSLAGSIAGLSPTAAAKVEQAGIFDVLIAQLEDPQDLLACMAGLEVLAELSESGSAVGGISTLPAMLRCTARLADASILAMLRCKALQ